MWWHHTVRISGTGKPVTTHRRMNGSKHRAMLQERDWMLLKTGEWSRVLPSTRVKKNPKHIARATTEWFRCVGMTQTSELNPPENRWHELKLYIYTHSQSNLTDLDLLFNISTCAKLVESLAAVISNANQNVPKVHMPKYLKRCIITSL